VISVCSHSSSIRSNAIERFGVALGVFVGRVGLAFVVSAGYIVSVAMEIADRNPYESHATKAAVTIGDVAIIGLVLVFVGGVNIF